MAEYGVVVALTVLATLAAFGGLAQGAVAIGHDVVTRIVIAR